MKNMWKWSALGFAALVVLALVGCGGLTGRIGDEGSLYISLGEMNARQILPDEPLDVDHYVIAGTGPSPFGPLTVTGSTLVEALLPGTYNVSVEAFNLPGTKIAAGSGSATVVIGATATCAIDVLEDTGLGHLALTANWSGAPVIAPVIDSYLRTGAEVDNPLTWTLGTNSATYAGDWANAWYILVFRLADDSVPVGGFVEAVRIAEGLTTTGAVDFVADAATGALDILLTLSMYDPIPIVSDVPGGDFTLYADATINASVAPADAGGVFSWWLDGVQMAVDVGSYAVDWDALDSALHYRLDLVYIMADGSGAGHVSWNLIKGSYSPAQLTISGGVSTPETPVGWAMTVTLHDAAGVQLDSQATTSGGSYSFPGLTPGDYAVKVKGSGSTDWSWWTLSAVKTQGSTPPANGIISVPTDGVTTYSFTWFIGG